MANAKPVRRMFGIQVREFLAVVCLGVLACQLVPVSAEQADLKQDELRSAEEGATVAIGAVKVAETRVVQPKARTFRTWATRLKDMRELLPDPTVAEKMLGDRLARLEAIVAERPAPAYRRVFSWFKKAAALTEGHLAEIKRERQVYMSLGECIRRALANNYGIRFEGYFPAIEVTRIVESEARFDPQVFFNFTEDKQDRPSSVPQLQGTFLETRSFNGGLRTLLPTGMQVEGRYSFVRSESDLAFQTINPSYTSNYALQLRQPMLRGFGLDFNRSQINVARNNHKISMERFSRQVQEILLEVERRYWELVQARREVPVQAELLAQSEQTLEVVEARLHLDTIPAATAQTRARVARLEGDFVVIKARLRDAEDRLKSILNDPELNLADDVEIVPTDDPSAGPIGAGPTDVLAAVQSALEYRTELREARLAVANTGIGVGVAKNQALPQLDVSFQVNYSGLGADADAAWDQLHGSDFIDYVVMVEVEWPIGNRGPRAALRRARLEQSQSLMAVKRVTEEVIVDVDLTAREVQTSYDQIEPSVTQALASADQIWVLNLRQERMDQTTLNTSFAAEENLAVARRSLLRALVGYNVAIVNLERAKGTLLEYNNVVLSDGR